MINRIRDIRKQKGMTLADVAAACDPPTTAQTIGRLETGMRNLSLGLDEQDRRRARGRSRAAGQGRGGRAAAGRRPADRDRRRGAGRARATRSCRSSWAATAPLVCLAIEAPQGEYRAGDQLWLRQIAARATRRG